MEKNGALEKYFNNFERLLQLNDKKEEYKELVGDSFFDAIINGVELKKKLSDENNEIINNYIVPLEQKEAISQDEFEEITNYIYKFKNAYDNLDQGMLRRLCRIRFKYAMNIGNLNVAIVAAYHCSFYEYSLQSAAKPEFRVHADYNLEYFKEHYYELNTEGKKYFLRLYSNQIIFSAFDLDKCLEILDYLKSREIDNEPDIDYEYYISTAERNITSLGIDYIEDLVNLNEEIPQRLIDKIYSIASTQYRVVNERKSTPFIISAPVKFIYFLAAFYKKYICINMLLNKLHILSHEKKNMNLEEKTFVFVKMSAYYIYYAHKYLGHGIDTIKEFKIDEKIKEAIEFVNTIPPSLYTRSMNIDILSFVKAITYFNSYEDVYPLFYQLTSGRSVETLIHSESVASLCKVLTKEMLRRKPEFFVGIMDDFNIEDIEANKEDILTGVYRMSILHDIGKYYCMPIISIDYRKLEDIEFAMIKNHSRLGHDLMRDKFPEFIKDGAMYHHLWHNSLGGYPYGYKQTNNLPLIDILSICDSLDAATDFLGRPYAKIKKLDELIEEFDSQRDTRYCGYVIDLLKIPEVFKEVENFLYIKRKEFTYKVYHREKQIIPSLDLITDMMD